MEHYYIDLYVFLRDSFRAGVNIELFDENTHNKKKIKKKLVNDDDFIGKFQIDLLHDDYEDYCVSLFILYNSNIFKLIHINKTKNLEKAKEIVKHIYSEINGFQEFIMTGEDEFYKKKGYYPAALPDKGYVDQDIRNNIKKERDDILVCSIITEEGILIQYGQIHPHF
jgi:hypothetical protein